MSNNISIQTPKGIIEAQIVKSNDYPGIQLWLNGEIVAVVEYDSFKNNVQVVTYEKTSDEPRDLYLYENGVDKHVLN